jgi:plasmid replication initiation protein
MTILQTVQGASDLLERSRAANDFLLIARALALAEVSNSGLPRARDYVIAERKGSERDRCVEFMKAAVSAGSTTGLQTLFNPLVTGFVESRPSRAR